MSNEIYSPIELTAPPYFEIESDDDFVSYGFPGSGNLTDPYIIENYGSIIEIISTTKHFIIRNCNFTGGGIRIVHVAPNTAFITNNTIDGSYIGIDIGSSENCTVTFNECRNNYGGGVELDHCSFAYVVNNTCIDTDYYGVGFLVRDSPYSTIANNTIIDGGMVGIEFESSTFSDIIDNSFTNGGLKCSDWYNYELYNVQSNTINSKLIGFFGNQSDLDLSDEVYGQILLSSCDNVTIKNQDFSNASYLLYAVHCDNLTFSYCNLSYSHRVLFIFYSSNLLFVNNHLFENHDTGNIHYAEGAILANNTLANNEWGQMSITRSNYSLISNNVCIENNIGIGVYVLL
jgi:parallel beta-helix repeat protein